MFRYLISNGFDGVLNYIIQLLLVLPICLLSLTVHEYCHGLAARRCGDHTAESLGRLTLNPLKHLDPIGFLCMLLFGFGWAKPVPINTRYFKNPRRDMALTALAGPASNLCLGIVFALLERVLEAALIATQIPVSLTENTPLLILLWFLSLGCQLNVYLAIFNLLPIPPFDGSRIFFIFLPPKFYFGIMKYERYIQIAMLILLWTGALTLPLSWLSGWVETGIYKLIDLIPYL